VSLFPFCFLRLILWDFVFISTALIFFFFKFLLEVEYI
jgi:hypothetical protein